MPEQRNEAAKPRKRGRGLTALVRWLHIYVSVLGFLALLFFALTGFTLNHAEWLCRGQEQVREMQGSIEPGLLGGEAVAGVSQSLAAFAMIAGLLLAMAADAGAKLSRKSQEAAEKKAAAKKPKQGA